MPDGHAVDTKWMHTGPFPIHTPPRAPTRAPYISRAIIVHGKIVMRRDRFVDGVKAGRAPLIFAPLQKTVLLS